MNRLPQNTSAPRAPFGVFAALTIVIFFCTLSAADSVGFVPYFIDGTESNRASRLSLNTLPELGDEFASVFSKNSDEQNFELPRRIRIDSIDLDLPVQNPETKDLVELDEILKKGPARYVDSALLGEDGNMIIFAHSSHLPIVHNQMYKAFNRIPELKSGDVIAIEGNSDESLYTVTNVRKADAEDAVIDLSRAGGQRLTLVTCDTLTGKSARFIVEAEFLGTFGK